MKPLKRHPALVSLSQDHHHALSLCARILRDPDADHRADIAARRAELERHFAEEETQFAPLWHALPDPALRRRFEDDHARLREMLAAPQRDAAWQRGFAVCLRDHARFEERELFEALAQYALPPFQAA